MYMYLGVLCPMIVCRDDEVAEDLEELGLDAGKKDEAPEDQPEKEPSASASAGGKKSKKKKRKKDDWLVLLLNVIEESVSFSFRGRICCTYVRILFLANNHRITPSIVFRLHSSV